ncbi:unnamed protein product [Lactuca saligna]|uniref:Cytidyltransferase-like domain-containing protein n=1 Tax=Lactuca saligna TaxID=75948 RepID=A0AA36A3W8_LACSI|nr:unnamed protein product [Lactuca saligna]
MKTTMVANHGGCRQQHRRRAAVIAAFPFLPRQDFQWAGKATTTTVRWWLAPSTTAGHHKVVVRVYGLIRSEHRITMCQLACKSSDFVMVDAWEAKQTSFQHSLTVLSRIRSFFSDNGFIPNESLKVMLVCGSDLLESFGIPGAWIPDQVRSICRDYGVVSIRRRDCISQGLSVKCLTSDEIIDYIKQNQLYSNQQQSV